MLTQRMGDALNKQINRELHSAYLYASMEAWFFQSSLDGFANWMKVQSKEEMKHASKLYNYIIERGNDVKLETIDAPETEWRNIRDVYERAYEHEKYITEEINNLYNIAEQENDKGTQIFLQWFITEQIEEEDSVRKIIDRLKLTECTGDAVFHLDTEFSTREEN